MRDWFWITLGGPMLLVLLFAVGLATGGIRLNEPHIPAGPPKFIEYGEEELTVHEFLRNLAPGDYLRLRQLVCDHP